MCDGRKTVELFYDVISPYSYLCFELLTRYSKKWTKLDLKLKPAYLRDIMIKAGNQSPGAVPKKKTYMGHDLMRLSAFYKIPLTIPKEVDNVMVVKGSNKAQRLLAAVGDECPEYLEEVTRQIYQRIWVRDEDISENGSLVLACESAKLPNEMISELIRLANEDSTIDRLQLNTDDALEKGVFGMPSMVLHSEENIHLFFGEDRIFMLAYYLGESVEPISK